MTPDAIRRCLLRAAARRDKARQQEREALDEIRRLAQLGQAQRDPGMSEMAALIGTKRAALYELLRR